MHVLVRAARAALALSMILVTMPAGKAQAGDSLLIWAPTKLSGYAYRLRMGAKAAARSDMSAGVDVSVATSSTGRIRNTRDNARFWAEMRGQGRSGGERNATAAYNPATGRASASAGVSRRWMATRSVDVVVSPSVSADANVRHGYNGSVRMTQKAQVQALRTGTSFIASGTAVTGSRRIGTELCIEQRVFDGLDLSASVRRQDAELIGAVRAQLRLRW
ncbi:hypothetical protein [Shinella sp. BYT-45]|uniref:hypothetical protein n=1 Tax=Shinella sp. BYT-45 TaxID=3377377 RepID=UPI00397ED692